MKKYFQKHQLLLISGFLILVIVIPIIVQSERVMRAENAVNTEMRAMPAKVQEAYENIQPNGKYANVANGLIAAGVVDEKIGDTEASICYVWPSHGPKKSFILPYTPIDGYEQRCYVRYTSGFYTNLTKTQVLENLQQYTLNDYYRSKFINQEDCKLDSFEDVAVRFAPAGSESFKDKKHIFIGYDDCTRPPMLQNYTGMKGAVYGKDVSQKIIKQIPDSEVDNTGDQIWLEEDVDYFEQPLTCIPNIITKFTLCSEPRNDPVQ